jgi:protein gp37
MTRGSIFPPVVVFQEDVGDGELIYWLADGFHRVAAARMANGTSVEAQVVDGSLREAVLYSLGANEGHGWPRTRAETVKCIERLLTDDEWVTWSDRWLADIVQCDNQTVSGHRLRMEAGGEIPHLDRLLDKKGVWQPRAKIKTKPAAPEVVTLEAWNAMGAKAKRAAVSADPSDAKFNRQDNDSIEWAQWSWNPITGCLHGCSYCYARDIADRFYPQGFVPALHPGRIRMPRKMTVPQGADLDIGLKNVFTCSMADLFGKWVPTEWIEALLAEIRQAKEWNFLFLTKFPKRLAEFEFPSNAWIGTSVDRQDRVEAAERYFADVNAEVKWLSVEPLLEPLKFSRLSVFNWIVLGGASASTQTPEWRPPRHWIDILEEQAHNNGLRIYEKANLLGSRIREYPGGPEMSYPKRAPDALFKTS